ncbi:hypothetical protein [[Mycoplasma] collis]|uniref:hypothetical protein n=1 Tax=[Mycoplasma] collis TaxID=2127 RepID=UPI00051B65B1|nr:hypothetical protein [[Mycoplasma] collis]
MKKLKKNIKNRKHFILFSTLLIASVPFVFVACANKETKDLKKIDSLALSDLNEKKSQVLKNNEDFLKSNKNFIEKINESSSLSNFSELQTNIEFLNKNQNFINKKDFFNKNLALVKFFAQDISEEIKAYNELFQAYQENNNDKQNEIVTKLKNKFYKENLFFKNPEFLKSVSKSEIENKIISFLNFEQIDNYFNSIYQKFLTTKYNSNIEEYKNKLKILANKDELNKDEFHKIISNSQNFVKLYEIENLINSLSEQSKKDLETINQNISSFNENQRKAYDSIVNAIKIYMKTINYYEKEKFFDFVKQAKLTFTDEERKQLFDHVTNFQHNYKLPLEILKEGVNSSDFYKQKIYKKTPHFIAKDQIKKDNNFSNTILIVDFDDRINPNTNNSSLAPVIKFYNLLPPNLIRKFELSSEDLIIQKKILNLREDFIAKSWDLITAPNGIKFNAKSQFIYQNLQRRTLNLSDSITRAILAHQIFYTRFLYTIDYVLANGLFYEEIYNLLFGYNSDGSENGVTEKNNYRELTKSFENPLKPEKK